MNELQATQIDRLNELHGEIHRDAQSLLEKVIEAGQILTEVKGSLPHGDFTQWVNDKVVFSMRTAQRYMKIYSHREELKNDSVSLLNDAHKMLTASAITESEPQACIDNINSSLLDTRSLLHDMDERKGWEILDDPLTPEEQKELARCEAKIEKGLQEINDIGLLLGLSFEETMDCLALPLDGAIDYVKRRMGVQLPVQPT